MFNAIHKHCLSEEPSAGEYLRVYSYTSWHGARDHTPPLLPVFNEKDGTLELWETSGKVIFRLNSLWDQYTTLHQYLTLAELNDGMFKFWFKQDASIQIYLNKEFFTKPLFLPRVIEPNVLGCSDLKLTLATNERLKDNLSELFQLPLYNYQANNVRWMVALEDLCDAQCNLLEYPKVREAQLKRAVWDNETYLWNNRSHAIYPIDYEDSLPIKTVQLQGGLLCDEVGLGKTASMFGLIVNTLERNIGFWDKPPTRKQLKAEQEDWVELPIEDNGCKWYSNATLVIGPTRLVGQWRDELDKFMLPLHDLRIIVLTSIVQYRKITAAELCNADIVLISDRFLINSNYRKHVAEDASFGLADFYWKRIILDEGHELLSTAPTLPGIQQRVYELKSRYRWVCTGTPFPHQQDSVDHYLYFLSGFKYTLGDCNYFDNDTVKRFLTQNFRWNNYNNIKQQIFIPSIVQTTVLLTQDPIERAMYVNATGDTTRMIQLCTHILVSETDASIVGDQMTSLEDVRNRMCDHFDAEVENTDRLIEMCETEQETAEQNWETAGDRFMLGSDEYREYRNAQRAAVRRWKNKIREHQDHIKSLECRKKLFETVRQRAQKEQCTICLDDLTDIALTRCGHIFCRECMSGFIKANPHNLICPLCRGKLDSKNDIGYMIAEKVETDMMEVDDSNYNSNLQKWGTKMAWLVDYLHHILSTDGNRVIIFSQWKRMLRMVGETLDECGIKQVYLKGSASQLARNIRRFKTSEDIRVIMLSSETCSSGSNLTEASHIVLLDTVNGSASQAKAIEDQAIGRAARLGQWKNVQVVRVIMKDTVEHDYYRQNISRANITELEGGQGIFP